MEFLECGPDDIKTTLTFIASGTNIGDAVHVRQESERVIPVDMKYIRVREKTVILDSCNNIIKTLPFSCKVLGNSNVLCSGDTYYYHPKYEPVEIPGILLDHIRQYIYTNFNGKIIVHDMSTGKTYKLNGNANGFYGDHIPLLVSIIREEEKFVLRCVVTGKKLLSCHDARIQISCGLVLTISNNDQTRTYYRVDREIRKVKECIICFKKIDFITKAFPCGHSSFCDECNPSVCPLRCKGGPIIKLYY